MHNNDCLHFCDEFSFDVLGKSNPDGAKLIIRIINENKYRLRFNGRETTDKHGVY